MSEAIIKVENIGKKYQIGERERYLSLRDQVGNFFKFKRKKNEEFWALKDINFEVKRGETLGIIGKNGSGKSTLLKVLSQITPPTTGKITLRGRVASLLEVGTGFHPELTGRENIFLNGAILGMSRQEIKRKFDEIVAFSEIEKFLDTSVKHYSSGMYVRLAFAVAAHLEPDILIVDEVLAVGDVRFQKKCLGKMNEVHKEGRTVLFVSHGMHAVKSLCDKTMLLENGKIVENGNTEKIINRYLKGNKQTNGGEFVKEWKKFAPENEIIKLEKVSFCDDKGKLLKKIDTDTPFNIEINYLIKKNGGTAGFTVVFYDDENNCILSSISNHEKKWYGREMKPGRYKTICKLPGRLLNDGNFILGINFFNNNFSNPVILTDVMQFTIMDGSFVRKDYFGGYGGALRPNFIWETITNPH